jgi:hypothetical protein
MLSDNVEYLQIIVMALIALSVPAQALWERIFSHQSDNCES